MISFLKRQFHGTRGIIHQIVENTTTVQNIQYFVNKEITGEPPRAVQLAMQLIAPKKLENVIEVSQHVKFFLPLKSQPIPQDIFQKIMEKYGMCNEDAPLNGLP